MLRAGGAAAIVVFLALVARFWHPVWGFTAFLQLDSTNDEVKIAAFKALPVYVYPYAGGYDGLYYAQLAYDPTLRSPELARAMDNFGYRARRILPPLLAYLVALGRPAWIVHVYSVLNVVAWLALAAVLWRLLPVDTWRSWIAWFGILFSAGAIASVRLALTDLIALAILAGAMLAVERSRDTMGAALVAAAALARETSWLAVTGLVRRPWLSLANIIRMGIASLPLAAWLVYIAWSFDSSDPGWSNLQAPLTGLVQKLVADVGAAVHHGDRLLAWTTLAATMGLIVQAAYFIVHPRVNDGWWRIGAIYVVLMLCLGTAVWEGFPGAATRVLLPMSLAFAVQIVRHRDGVVWILAGNLAVFSGLIGLRGVPSDPHELAAGRVAGAAVLVRGDDRWTNVQRGWRHMEAASGPESDIVLETWPHDDRDVEIEATVRSGNVVVLTVSQDGAVLWRNTIFGKPLRFAVPVRIRSGRARVSFSAGTPGAPQGTMSGTRASGFLIENLRVN